MSFLKFLVYAIFLFIFTACSGGAPSESPSAGEDGNGVLTTDTIPFPVEACESTFNRSHSYGNDSLGSIMDYDCLIEDFALEGEEITNIEIIGAINYHDVIDSIVWRGPRDIVGEVYFRDDKSIRVKFFWGYNKRSALRTMKDHMRNAKLKFSIVH